MKAADSLIRQMYGKKVNQIMDKIDELKKQIAELEKERDKAMEEELQEEYWQLFDSEGKSHMTFTL